MANNSEVGSTLGAASKRWRAVWIITATWSVAIFAMALWWTQDRLQAHREQSATTAAVRLNGVKETLTLADAMSGEIAFDSKAGKCDVNLSELTDDLPRKTFDFGGLDMSVTIERYPENPIETKLELDFDTRPPAGKTTPYFVKATQVDGQMAWASPIYLRRTT